jgi:hypothetical protein
MNRRCQASFHRQDTAEAKKMNFNHGFTQKANDE